MYDMAESNAKKNVIDMLENLGNDIKRVQNALRDNEEKPKLEVNETSNTPPTLPRTMGQVLNFCFAWTQVLLPKAVVLIS